VADNVDVSNSPTSINPDIPVRTTQTASNEHIQHMRIDVGSGATESVVSSINPLPVAGTFTVDPAGLATEAKQTTGNASLNSIDGKITICNTGAVTVSAALPAGTNNIGDVDVLTLPNVTLASQLNPFTSAIPISDNAGSITVDGTVAATQSGTWNINNVSGTVSLPTGAATETTLSALNGKVTACNTGAVTISAALPAGANNIGDVDVLTLPNVILASQANPFTSAIPISDNAGSITVDGTVAATQSGTWNITNVSGTISLPTGAATESTLSTLNGKVTACNTGAVTISTALPAGTNNIGDVDVLTLPDVALKNYSTSAVTSVVSAATSTSVLASNANRRMAIMVNDTDRNTYVKLGATASTTSFSYKLSPGQILELPIPIYTGAIDAIWDASPTGSMRVTEIT
jgi:hypothetical protein